MSDDRLLKVPQAAILLNVCEETIRRRYWAGKLPFVRMAGGEIRIPLSAVEAYRQHHEVDRRRQA